MSETQQGDDWWMATDGKWYPPQSHPSNWQEGSAPPQGLPSAPPAPVAPVGSSSAAPDPSSSGLGAAATAPQATLVERWQVGKVYSQITATLIGIGVVGVLAASIGILGALGAGEAMSRYLRPRAAGVTAPRALSEWQSYENFFFVMQFSVVALWIVFTVATVAWLYNACRTARSTGALGQQWTPGWAIAGFFIPLVNLVVPFLVASQVTRVASAVRAAAEDKTHAALQSWEARSLSIWVVLWWLGFAGWIGFGIAFRYQVEFAYFTNFRSLSGERSAWTYAYTFGGVSLFFAGIAFGALSQVAYQVRNDFRRASERSS